MRRVAWVLLLCGCETPASRVWVASSALGGDPDIDACPGLVCAHDVIDMKDLDEAVFIPHDGPEVALTVELEYAGRFPVLVGGGSRFTLEPADGSSEPIVCRSFGIEMLCDDPPRWGAGDGSVYYVDRDANSGEDALEGR